MTDGRDEDNPGTAPGSVRTFDEVLRAAGSAGTMVFGIGVGQKVDGDVLRAVASATGGAAYFADDVSQLEGEVPPDRGESATPMDDQLYLDE